MNESKSINANQLFLLCSMRDRAIVKAKNTDEYSWTVRHWSYVQHLLVDLEYSVAYDKSKRDEFEKKFQKEAEEKFPIQKSEFRSFTLRVDDFVTLTDFNEDLSWYSPFLAEEWAYKGNFLLEKPLSQKEALILRVYC